MIGLERGRVRLADHDPDWIRLGAEECRAVRSAAGYLALDVQHVGSTAVPGLPAKPILDIAAAVETLADIPALAERLAEAGYEYRRDSKGEGGHLFIRESQPGVRVVYLHVVERADPQWEQHILFRDALRRDEGLRAAYAELKRGLAERYPEDRGAYTAAKSDFIQGVLGEGRGAGDPSSRPGPAT